MKYAKYILILALLAASGACTNDFEDYNTNPNKQSEGSVAPIALLEPLIYSSTNSYSSYMLSIANEISQVTVAKSTPRREHCYNLADGNFKAIWNLGYKWAGNAKHMYDLAVAQNQPNFQAIGLTLKVYNMSILTDMFGSIAYREALEGRRGHQHPAYRLAAGGLYGHAGGTRAGQLALQRQPGAGRPHQGRHLRRRHRQVAEIHQHAAPASADARERP